MSMLDDLYLLDDSDNHYAFVKQIAKSSRKLLKDYPRLLDSQALSHTIHHTQPNLKYKQSTPSLIDNVLSHVSDEDVIHCVIQSLKYSDKSNIHYVYLDTMSEGQMSRVRVLVNMMLLN